MAGTAQRIRHVASLLAAAAIASGALAQEAPATADALPEPAAAQPADAPATVEPVPVIPVATQDTPEPLKSDSVSAGAVRLEDVVVTATKRMKSQRDIPGSVGAMRGQDLEKISAQGMKDYFKLIPGVTFADQGNEESVPIIRGISTSISFGATANTTGVYLDDMPFADLFGPSSVPDLNPFDLDRVEVLKGPQGTLFGSGALAGAVRYIVQKPRHGLWEAKVSETVSRTSESDGLGQVTSGAVNVPLFGEAVALRAVGVFRKEPGVYDSSATSFTGQSLRNDPDADRLKQRSLRALGSWHVLDSLSLSGFYFEQKTHTDDFGFADQPQTPENRGAPFPSPHDHDFSGGNLLLTWDLPWAQLLITSNRMFKNNYSDQHEEFGVTLPGVNGGLGNQNALEYMAIFGDKVNGYTHEVRFSSAHNEQGYWDWLIGAAYLHYGDSNWQFTWLGPDIPDPTEKEQVTTAQKAAGQVYSTNDQVATERALFGEATLRLGERWELTAGARKYRTGLLADNVLCGAQTLALFQTLCYPQHFEDSSSGLNPKLSIRYKYNRNWQVYALAAKGFQFGGVQVNPPAPGFPQSAAAAGYSFGPYKSSTLWNYEAGVRTEWLERRLRFDLTAFHLAWKDLQLTIAVPLAATNVPFNLIANVGRAHSDGVEAALEALPFEGLKFASSAAYINAVTDVLFDQQNADGGVKPGTRLPGTPHFQLSNQLSYEHTLPWFEHWQISPSLVYVHLGTSPDAIRPTGSVGGYDTLDARLSLMRPDSRFQPEFAFAVNNVRDVRGVSYHLHGNSLTNGPPFDFTHFIQPRTLIGTVSLRF